MTERYEKYFGDGDISRGKASMMLDIKKHRLAGRELADLIDDLEAAGMLTSKPFAPELKEHWDEDYLTKLSGGHISDYFSRPFLEHFGEVAEYVARNRVPESSGLKPGLLIGAAVAVCVLLLAYWFFSSRADGAAPAPSQDAQLLSSADGDIPPPCRTCSSYPARTTISPVAFSGAYEMTWIREVYRNGRHQIT